MERMRDELLYEAQDGIGTMTFNRPHAPNAADLAMYERLAEILVRLEPPRGSRPDGGQPMAILSPCST
jgi:enoyl-CoA hydratase/carnithine racemase